VKRVLFLLMAPLVWLTTVPATMPSIHKATVWLNKPGIALQKVSESMREKLRQRTGADRIDIGVREGVAYIAVVKTWRPKPKQLVVAIDLRPVFSDKSCLGSWENFDLCSNKRRNENDEDFVRILDRTFYSKLICQKGCRNKSFLKWWVYWKSPERIMLKADIGATGGFADLEEAKKSIEAVNALLSKVLIDGPRFPESEFEAIRKGGEFYVEAVSGAPYDFAEAIRNVLTTLQRQSLLKGIDSSDIKAIAGKTHGGISIYYFDEKCGQDQATAGWRAIYNNTPIRFDKNGCAHIIRTRGR
jgi:hypothetical protein